MKKKEGSVDDRPLYTWSSREQRPNDKKDSQPKPSRQETYPKIQLVRRLYGTRMWSRTPWDWPRQGPHGVSVAQMSSTGLTRY